MSSSSSSSSSPPVSTTTETPSPLPQKPGAELTADGTKLCADLIEKGFRGGLFGGAEAVVIAPFWKKLSDSVSTAPTFTLNAEETLLMQKIVDKMFRGGLFGADEAVLIAPFYSALKSTTTTAVPAAAAPLQLEGNEGGKEAEKEEAE